MTRRKASDLRQVLGQRRGAVLAAVLVCMLVVMIVGAVLIKASVARNRQSRLEQHRLQATWLAESGVERAAAKLHQSADYTGETWQIDAEQLDGRHAGVVTIRIEEIDEQMALRLVHVEAHFPDVPHHRALVTKQVRVVVSATEAEE